MGVGVGASTLRGEKPFVLQKGVHIIVGHFSRDENFYPLRIKMPFFLEDQIF